jgi:hypothetical protein
MKISIRSVSLFFVTLTWCCQPAHSNMAAPYINTGGSQTIEPFNKADKKSIDQIQMVSEVVKVNLYPGFAVVKGEYHMLNTADRPIKIQVGYPPNRSFERKLNGDSMETRIRFGSDDKPRTYIVENGIRKTDETKVTPFSGVDQLKVLVADKEIETKTKVITNQDRLASWGVWDLEFLPRQETVVIVYYMVNTKGHISQGYSGSKDARLFTYVLESGQIWRDRIKQGSIFIKLNGGLDSNDIWGVLPSKTLQINQTAKYLIYQFTDLEPTVDDNIVINYNDKLPAGFDYQQEQAKSKGYYQQIDQVSLPTAGTEQLRVASQDNFSGATLTNTLAIIGIVLLLTSPIWLTILLIVLAIFLFVRWKNRKSNKNKQ